tara:strand:- start:2536 stop:3735 length:1200 start_codon:yes stop_codon:yes gene_type:complete
MSLNLTFFDTLSSVYKAKDFSFFMLALSLFLLPLSVNLSSIALVTSLAIKFVQVIFFKHKWYAQTSLKYSSLIGFIFLFYVFFNAILQTNFTYTITVFEKEFSHFGLLFLAPMLLRNKLDNKLLIYTLALGLITAVLFVFFKSYVLQIDFDKFAFIKILDIHHTYLSIFILFFVNILLTSIPNKVAPNFKTSLIIALSFLLVAFTILFILGSKVSMIIYLIFILVSVFLYFFRNRSIKILVILPVLIICFFVFNKKIDTTYKAALNFRVEIWQESINSIQEKPFFGNLQMIERDLLNFNHYKSGKYYLMDSDLNSHNQFLSILMKFGFVGALILSLLIVNLFMFKHKNVSKKTLQNSMGFFVIVFFTFYIENVLDRHHGIVFFSLFFNYYLVSISDEKS